MPPKKQKLSPEKRAEIGKESSIIGFANQHIALGILMKKYFNVSLVDLPHSPYDIVIVRETESGEDFIRCQVKTAQKGSISFTGGGRGGVDREYKSGIKEYVQSTKTSDVVIGIYENKQGWYDLYFVPTILIEKLNQKSISLKKVYPLKNNYNILEKCKEHENVLNMCRELLDWF